MFNSNKEKSDLDKAIDAVHARMNRIGPDDPEYKQQLKYLERLSKLRADSRWKRPDTNTILSVAGSVLGIAIIVGYERANVMTSKAINLVAKPSNLS
jgi:hypothetical protein